MSQLEHIDAIERRLWAAADTLRANSNYAGNEYFLPVMGLVFLRHAYSRYLALKDEVTAGLPTRGGKRRTLAKEDFSQKSAIFLRPEAQFDYLVALPDGQDRAGAIIAAMESIEEDYASLRGVLPKSEYQELNNDVLGQLLRTLNPDELKRVSGDVFGRIYEYFLTQFADQKAHDGGEFFTPVSLVSLIAHVLNPERGTVLDPACGSGGMFVRSAGTVEEHGQRPAERLTFRGLEKNATTIRLARMNLAVHGLEGDIRQAITYYEDPHELLGKADYVMANPPFNVDEIDADKVTTDPRLPFGLPGVNKKGKVSNGNYVRISYFYGYLNETGRAGFVMSSQASGAGGGEAEVRRRLVETGDADVMIAIRSNFFYTRTVPCELWFLNRAKPKARRDKVLMIDARNVSRKVTRKIYDFSPEQQQNLLAIVWLYRGETERYLDVVSGYCTRTLNEANACFRAHPGPLNRGEERMGSGKAIQPLPDFLTSLTALRDTLTPFLDTLTADGAHAETLDEWDEALLTFTADADAFRKALQSHLPASTDGGKNDLLAADPAGTYTFGSAAALRKTVHGLAPLTETSRGLVKRIDVLYKLAARLIEICERECNARTNSAWNGRAITLARKAADEARRNLTKQDEPFVHAWGQLRKVRDFWRQAHWLTERFPDATLHDVEGLVKLVDRAEIKANDWSLTPGRYVGVTPEEEDEHFDVEMSLREIHVELETLNVEAGTLAATIKKNFEELGI